VNGDTGRRGVRAILAGAREKKTRILQGKGNDGTVMPLVIKLLGKTLIEGG
jgi:hypothetical protein